MNKVDLQRAPGVWFLAIAFLIAPFGNLLISFAGSGVGDWYKPTILLSFMNTVPVLDWIWLTLVGLTGVLLLKPHKSTWTLAIMNLTMVIAVNIYRGFYADSGIGSNYYIWQILISGAISICVLVVLIYFRFPFLDRRGGWLFAVTERRNIRTPVLIVFDKNVEGVTQSLSGNGTKILLQRDIGHMILNNPLLEVVFTDIGGMKIRSKIVSYQDNILTVKFRSLSSSTREILDQWIKTRMI